MSRMTDKEFQNALRGIMLSTDYQHRCCGRSCRIDDACEACGRINRKVDENEVDEQLFAMYTMSSILSQQRQSKQITDGKRKAGTNNELLITFVFDQVPRSRESELKAIENQKSVIEALQCADYRWFRDCEVLYNFEYFTKDGTKWKPHLHLALEKTAARSTIQQTLYTKFVEKKKFDVYGVNVVVRPNKVAKNYVKGLKRADKSVACDIDDIFREENDLKKFYYF